MSNILIAAQNVRKSFNDGDLSVDVLKGIEFSIERNQSIAIIGASGSGKSTLLHLLAGLDIPDSGNIFINNKSINELNNEERGQLRNECLGFIYQFHHLLPEFTAKENVAMPLLIRRCTKRAAYEKAEVILSEVGLSERMMHKPGELSGGERQRTAIARALVTNPSCMLADEPTGNLDEKSANEVFELILELNQNHNSSLIMVTHNIELSRRADKICELRDGVLIDI
jgi:lipoprotein-releasing system ATP-binding protein